MSLPGYEQPRLSPESLEEADSEPELPAQQSRLLLSISWRVVLIVVALLALSLIAGFGGPLVLSLLAQLGP